jgi:hypothetical protein
MVRRLLIALCIAVLATAGAARPWTDGDPRPPRMSVETLGRALGAAMALRGKLNRETPPALWLPATAGEAGARLPVVTLVVLPPASRQADLPRDGRRPARAPPRDRRPGAIDAGGRSAVTSSLSS